MTLYDANMITFNSTKLANGLRVLLVPLHETQAVTALLLVKVGSRYETRKLNGLSHFIEHLMFKGTKKRPSTLEISHELDSVGAEYNAFTSKDHTGYYIKLNHEKIRMALDILSDMVFQSTFAPQEIERERGVIVEEINMYEDNPMMLTEDLFEETMFGDTPLGWRIAGPKENIRTATREEILGLRDAYHVPGNMILVISGRLPANIRSLVAQYFSVPRLPRRGKPFLPYRGKQAGPRVHIHYKDTQQVHLAMGVPAYRLSHPKLYALYVLSVIVGGNMSSRLFISIRERQGLCYFIRSSVNPYEDSGTFMVQAGIERKRIHHAISAILKELSGVSAKGVTDDELQKAKEYMRGKLILNLEDSESIASWVGKQLLLRGRIISVKDQLAKIQRVTAQQVHEAARDIFVSRLLTLIIIGPYRREGEFRRLLHF